MECCGHDGTLRHEGGGLRAVAASVGQKAFAGMKDAAAEVWATDCPLAALQFEQHAGKKPMHPMSILARAYRGDGFPSRRCDSADRRERRGGRRAMKTVARDEILDYVTYEEQREHASARPRCATKAARRVHVGDAPDVPVREPRHGALPGAGDGAHRAHGAARPTSGTSSTTYNELLGGAGELGCTLLIEIDDPALRAEKLTQWLDAARAPVRELRGRNEGVRALRRAPGRRHARLVGAVPEVRGRRPRRRSPSAATTRTPSCATRRS